MAMGLPPFMGMNVGPVRPLAKSADYDRRFDQLIEQIDPARRQGLVDIISSYDLTTSSQTTMGAVLTGGYPLNPQLLLWAFRSIAREQSVLNAALEGDDQLMGLPDEQIEALSVGPAKADGGINDDPALPLLERSLARDHLRESLTLIARGRIAATMKSIGYCAAKDLVPVFSEPSFDRLAHAFALRAANLIDQVAEEDPYWSKRSKALEIAHDEYLNEQTLNGMPIEDVLKLRTVVWDITRRHVTSFSIQWPSWRVKKQPKTTLNRLSGIALQLIALRLRNSRRKGGLWPFACVASWERLAPVRQFHCWAQPP